MIERFEWHKHSIEGLSAAWMLPIVPAVVAAASGGIVASVLPPDQARLTLIASCVLMPTWLSLFLSC
jgi:tellurite resistance protein TehA-like permease